MFELTLTIWLGCVGVLGVEAAGPAETPPVVDTVVVCPTALRPALEPWLAHRRRQGHHLVVLSDGRNKHAVREALRAYAAAGGLRNVLLVGDAEPHAERDPRIAVRHVPTHLAPARINVRWGSEPEIATDNWYADLNDDLLPELAVGRLSADDADELTVIVEKILEYERNPPRGDWRRRLNFVAGVGGFGGIIDGVLETATKKLLTDGVPPAYQTTMTYGSWRSPFCPDPRQFHQTTLLRLNEGALCWVYLGHGQRNVLDRVRVPGSTYRILERSDMHKLRRQQGAPIAVFLACYTAAYDGVEDCLAEELLRAPEGPVAVLGGSRVTMPYAMATLGDSLLHELFIQQRETLGEMVLQAKLRMASEKAASEQAASEQTAREQAASEQTASSTGGEQTADKGTASEQTVGPTTGSNRRLLDSIAAVVSPTPELLLAERREHLLLFNLLGDPLLRIPHAEPLVVESATEVQAGETLTIRGQSPLAGQVTVELVCRRDRSRVKQAPRRRFDASHEALTEYAATYAAANDHCWVREQFRCETGSFEHRLQVPVTTEGPCHVRLFVEQGPRHALGATDVHVHARPATQTRVSRRLSDG